MDDASPGRTPPAPLVSTRGLARALTAMLGVYLAIQVAHFTILALLRDVVQKGEQSPPWLAWLDLVQVRMPLATAALYVACGVCFLVMVARLTRNLPTLG